MHSDATQQYTSLWVQLTAAFNGVALFSVEDNSLNLLVVVLSRVTAVYLIKSSKFGYSCFDRVTTTSFEFLLSFGFQLLQLLK